MSNDLMPLSGCPAPGPHSGAHASQHLRTLRGVTPGAGASTSAEPAFSGPASGVAGDRGGDLAGAAASEATGRSGQFAKRASFTRSGKETRPAPPGRGIGPQGGSAGTTGATYRVNRCLHCGALQGAFDLCSEPDGPLFGESEDSQATRVLLTEKTIEVDAGSYSF